MTPSPVTDTKEGLHAAARYEAGWLEAHGRPIVRKQLRWNDIVEASLDFYPSDPEAGVRELVESACSDSPAFVVKDPWAERLTRDYGWMTQRKDAR